MEFLPSSLFLPHQPLLCPLQFLIARAFVGQLLLKEGVFVGELILLLLNVLVVRVVPIAAQKNRTLVDDSFFLEIVELEGEPSLLVWRIKELGDVVVNDIRFPVSDGKLDLSSHLAFGS